MLFFYDHEGTTTKMHRNYAGVRSGTVPISLANKQIKYVEAITVRLDRLRGNLLKERITFLVGPSNQRFHETIGTLF